MCELIDKFIDLMKPFILNIEEIYNILGAKEVSLNDLNDIINRINGESTNILNINYDDISDFIEEYKSNKTEYDANKYILKSDIKEVKSLPQYKKSKKYFDEFSQFLTNKYDIICDEYTTLKKDYNEKELINKYYKMIVSNSVFVNDVDEIKNVFDILNLSVEEKNVFLIYIMKENGRKYNIDYLNDTMDEHDMEKVIKIINDNKKYKHKEYNELINVVSEYVDISKELKDIVNIKLIDKINIANIVLAKKIWLYRKMDFSFHNMNCKKCKCIMNEYEKVDELYKAIKNVKTQEGILRIIMGEEYEG